MAKLNTINSESLYEVNGSELINLHEKLERVYGDMSFAKNQLREAFDIIQSEETFPKFVARVAMVMDNLTNDLVRFRNSDLRTIGVGLDLEEAKPTGTCSVP